MNYETLLPILRSKYEDGPERIGFVLEGDEVVEVNNVCSDPTDGFEYSGEDLIKYEARAVASWHTHPGDTSCLSVSDFYGFRSWPQWLHFIIGSDGLIAYQVRAGKVVIAERWPNAS